MKINQKGFGVIEGLLLVIALTLIVFVGFYVANANKDDKKSTSDASQEDNSTKKNVNNDPTKDWKEFSTPDYTLKHPASWVSAKNPELCSDGIYLFGADENSVGACGTDGGSHMAFQTLELSSLDNITPTKADYPDLVTKEVSAGGIPGTRYSGTYNSNGEPALGPEDGDKMVIYLFKSPDKAYEFSYHDRVSRDFPDVLADFDLMVTKTLKFIQ